MIEKEATIKDVQSKIYEVMEYVATVCEQNNIKYFLSGGTLLGAIRHNGFIPWDDDADIMLLRPEYEKLMRVMSQNPDERFVLESVNNDDLWTRPWARVCDNRTLIELDSINDKATGVYVDILPIDGLPNNSFVSLMYAYRIKFLNILRNSSMRQGFVDNEKYVFAKKILGLLTRNKTSNFYANKINRICSAKKVKTRKYCGVVCIAHYIKKERFLTSWFKATDKHSFEKRDFLVPAEYDKYLSTLYGDYMKLPPKEKQCATHFYKLISLQEADK